MPKKSKDLKFSKYQSTGNDFIVVDNRQGQISARWIKDQEFWAKACHRRYGIGADGILFLQKGQKPHDYVMGYMNADGAPVEMCGNGSRALADYALRKRPALKNKKLLQFQSNGVTYKVKWAKHKKSRWPSVLFPKAQAVNQINWAELGQKRQGITLNTGVPHVVILIDSLEELDKLNLEKEALPLRHHRLFPRGTNVNYIAINPNKTAPWHLAIRTFERGVEAETYSCGTGAVAAAYFYKNFLNPSGPDTILLKTKGGPLSVEVVSDGFWLAGPTELVYEGTLEGI